jgi:putative DNA primase/helicase
MITPEFEDAIRAHGMEPPNDMEPGKFYRMPGIDKDPHNRSGWCVLFEDALGGAFGDWSSGFSEVWFAQSGKPLTKEDKAAFSQRVRESKVRATKNQRVMQEKAAIKANSIYAFSAPPPENFPYLVTKQIKPHNARLVGDRLALPIMDISQNITSIQYIAENGDKRLLPGGRKKGCYIPLNQEAIGASTVIICEGWATGATLAEDYPTALVLAAIDAGNLSSVATGAANKWSNTELIIAADDDRSKPYNVGLEKAKEAAKLVGAQLLIPIWPSCAPMHLSDFNDLAVHLKGQAE